MMTARSLGARLAAFPSVARPSAVRVVTRALRTPNAYDPYDFLADVPAFDLKSETISEGGTMPPDQLSGAFGMPGGKDVSPQLTWSGAPADTKSFVVTCFDPDAPTVSGFWHWCMYDIPPSVTSLPANAGEKGSSLLPPGATSGLSHITFKK